MLVEHMEKGFSFESFAGVLSVTKPTIYEWVKEHDEFSNAKGIGTEKSRIFWEDLGVRHILNESKSTHGIGSKSKSLNASVWVFNMKNRFGWRDKQPEEVEKTIVNNNSVSVTNDQLQDLLKKARGEK